MKNMMMQTAVVVQMKMTKSKQKVKENKIPNHLKVKTKSLSKQRPINKTCLSKRKNDFSISFFSIIHLNTIKFVLDIEKM